MNELFQEKMKRSQILIQDANTGWRQNAANNRIDINVGTFKPGTASEFKVKFEGQKLTISAVKAHCPCTKNIEFKKIEHEELGTVQIIKGTIDVLSKEELKNTDENVQKGAELVARYIALDIIYAETEIEHFVVNGTQFELNPMSFYTRINVHYNIDLS